MLTGVQNRSFRKRLSSRRPLLKTSGVDALLWPSSTISALQTPFDKVWSRRGVQTAPERWKMMAKVSSFPKASLLREPSARVLSFQRLRPSSLGALLDRPRYLRIVSSGEQLQGRNHHLSLQARSARIRCPQTASSGLEHQDRRRRPSLLQRLSPDLGPSLASRQALGSINRPSRQVRKRTTPSAVQ